MFKLDQILTKNKYNKGVAATVRYDVVDLGKPGPDDWFRIYKLGDNNLDDYPLLDKIYQISTIR